MVIEQLGTGNEELTGEGAKATAEVLEAAAVSMDASTSVVNLGELLPALVACPARHKHLNVVFCTE